MRNADLVVFVVYHITLNCRDKSENEYGNVFLIRFTINKRHFHIELTLMTNIPYSNIYFYSNFQILMVINIKKDEDAYPK